MDLQISILISIRLWRKSEKPARKSLRYYRRATHFYNNVIAQGDIVDAMLNEWLSARSTSTYHDSLVCGDVPISVSTDERTKVTTKVTNPSPVIN